MGQTRRCSFHRGAGACGNGEGTAQQCYCSLCCCIVLLLTSTAVHRPLSPRPHFPMRPWCGITCNVMGRNCSALKRASVHPGSPFWMISLHKLEVLQANMMSPCWNCTLSYKSGTRKVNLNFLGGSRLSEQRSCLLVEARAATRDYFNSQLVTDYWNNQSTN